MTSTATRIRFDALVRELGTTRTALGNRMTELAIAPVSYSGVDGEPYLSGDQAEALRQAVPAQPRFAELPVDPFAGFTGRELAAEHAARFGPARGDRP